MYTAFLADTAVGGDMLTCKATLELKKANEATTETLWLEASTRDALLRKIRAELANRKGFMLGRITTETEKRDEAASGESGDC